MHKYHIRFDTLTTVTPLNVDRVEELYEFIFRELRPAVAQFQRLRRAAKDHATVAPGHWPADTILPVGDPRLRPGYRKDKDAAAPAAAAGGATAGDGTCHESDSIMTDWSISAQQWGQFLCTLFDLWWERDRNGTIIVTVRRTASSDAGVRFGRMGAWTNN